MLKIKLYTCQGKIESLIAILKVKILISVSVLKFVYMFKIPLFLSYINFTFIFEKISVTPRARTAGERRNTCTVEELIIEQAKIFNRLKNCHFNFIGKYKTNITIGALESRIITLG